MRFVKVICFTVFFFCFATAAAWAADAPYTRSAGQYYTIEHQVTVTNPASKAITGLEVLVPLAEQESVSWQDFVGEELTPQPEEIRVAADGSRTAVYYFERLEPGEVRTLTQRFAVENFAVEFQLNAAEITWDFPTLDNRYLAPEKGVESDDAAVVQYAKTTIEEENNPYIIARSLFSDIGRFLQYQKDTSAAPSAVAALTSGVGSCEEYTYLFVASLRALGIPARWHSGYLYLPQEHSTSPYLNEDGSINGDEIRHVWAEVYLPPVGWVIVDPTYSYTFINGDVTQKIVDWDKFAHISRYERHLWLTEGHGDVNNITYTSQNEVAPHISFQAKIYPLLRLNPFRDLEGHWAKESILALTAMANPVMVGVGDAYFGVNEGLTRAQLVTVINRVFGYQHDQETTTFYDVSQEHWAKDEIAVAQARGYITGYPDGTFRPDVPVSRGELAAILATVAHLPQGSATPFTDLTQSGWSWCKNAVESMYSAGLAAGVTSDSFAPQQTLTRGEGAVFIYRFMQSSYYSQE